MKNTQFIICLFTLIFLASCSKSEICPEKEEPLLCNHDAFAGTWEFVGYDFQVEEGTCLSNLVLDPSTKQRDITINISDSPKGLEYGLNFYKIKTNSNCMARETSINSLTEALLFDSKLELVNPNYLIVSDRIFIGWNHKVYRRKN